MLKRPVSQPNPTRQPPRETPDAATAQTSVSPAVTTAPPASAAPAQPSNAVAGWRGELIGRLQRAKRYPDAARERAEQGAAIVTFTMDRTGHIIAASLVRSSGSQALDDEAIALLRRAEPLPALPADLAGATVKLTVPVTFSLQ